MRTKTIVVASFVLPLLLLACNQADQSPTAAKPGQEKQASTPSSEDRMLEKSAPAAGAPGAAETSSSAMPPPKVRDESAAPATPPSEPKKAY